MHQATGGDIPQQGGASYLGGKYIGTEGRDLEIPPDVGGCAGGGTGGDIEVHLRATEYGCAIHCAVTYYRPLPGGRAEASIGGT